MYRQVFFYRNPAQISNNEDVERLRQKIECALDGIAAKYPYYRNILRDKSQFTLNFLYERLSEKFEYHQITSNVEKAHFLSQVFQETVFLVHTVEKYGRSRWNDVLKVAKLANDWNCDVYYNAMVDDKYSFDHVYNYSKIYKAKFRGRGLIQLTGCHNYLNFFYNQAALKQSRPDLVRNLDILFSYIDSNGRRKSIKRGAKFCTNEVLQSKI